MKALIAVLAVVFTAGATVPAASAAYGYPVFQYDAQADKRRGGPERGQQPREMRTDRAPDRGERRERLNDDERRALHRDLDKANREIYQRRHP